MKRGINQISLNEKAHLTPRVCKVDEVPGSVKARLHSLKEHQIVSEVSCAHGVSLRGELEGVEDKPNRSLVEVEKRVTRDRIHSHRRNDDGFGVSRRGLDCDCNLVKFIHPVGVVLVRLEGLEGRVNIKRLATETVGRILHHVGKVSQFHDNSCLMISTRDMGSTTHAFPLSSWGSRVGIGSDEIQSEEQDLTATVCLVGANTRSQQEQR